jgi:two-component system chemotaxis response regulator CheY
MQQETILVVEDFIAVQQFLRETLESLGYKTLGATNGNRAYEILEGHSQRINLVLTDYHMPDSTGYDLIKKIKANSQLKNIPIILLTAESNPDIITKAESLGISSWIKKPYRAEFLSKEIARVMNQSK